MPWTPDQFREKHNQDLDKPQSEKAAGVANAILKKTGDEGKAIRIANSQVGRYRSHLKKSDGA